MITNKTQFGNLQSDEVKLLSDILDAQRKLNSRIADSSIFYSSINTTAGDAATIDAVAGRFRKDTSGTTFTLTNKYITANSVVLLQVITAGLTAGYLVRPSAGAGTCTITFENAGGTASAPNANCDVNFWIVN